MSRRMSCSMTIDAVRARTKTVTRRHPLTWANLTYDDRLTLIEKGMGLPKGAKQVVLAQVEIVDVRLETLRNVTDAEVVAEGLWGRAVDEGAQFVDYFVDYDQPVVWFRAFWAAGHHGGKLRDWAIGRLASQLMGVECRRIEWRYLDGES